MNDISNRHFALCLFMIIGIVAYVLVNVNWDKVNAEESEFNPMTYTETTVIFDESKSVICWGGKPYHSYFNTINMYNPNGKNEIGLYMIDLIPELNGVQQLIVNQTGLCNDSEWGLQSHESENRK